MKKLIEYLTIALSIGGTLCLVGAAGAIDGGYNGIPMNDNWGACFVLAGLGLPGTSGFLGEFLVLIGAFKKNYLVAVLASIGVILGAAYMLWLTKRVIFGMVKNSEIKSLKDLNILEGIILSLLAISTIFFGFYPQLLLDTMNVSVNYLIQNYEADLAINTLTLNDK